MAETTEKTGLVIVDDQSKAEGAQRGDVCVEGDSLEDVRSTDARELALKHAATMGLHRPGFSGGGWTEWVDDKGNVLRGEAFRAATKKRARIHYPVQAGF